MLAYRCDNCQKVIKKDEVIIIGREIWKKLELCPDCAEPIVSGIPKPKLGPQLKEKIKM